MIKIEVKEGLLPWIVGIGSILLGIMLMFGMILHPDDSPSVMLGVYSLILCMIAAGILLCMDAKNRMLTVENASLCYTNCFGKKKAFTLQEIGYCRVAMENQGAKDSIKVYDVNGKKLCKLEFNMKDGLLFVQYLLDNQIEVECSDKSDEYLKRIIYQTIVLPEEAPERVNCAYEDTKRLVEAWETRHKKFRAQWKMGITVYLRNEMSENKQLWEETGYTGICFDMASGNNPLPEETVIGIEGYLQRGGQFVCDRKNRPVMFYVPLISVTKSFQIGDTLKIRFRGGDVLEELSDQLALWAELLPKNRYHTEDIVLQHELKERL